MMYGINLWNINWNFVLIAADHILTIVLVEQIMIYSISRGAPQVTMSIHSLTRVVEIKLFQYAS